MFIILIFFRKNIRWILLPFYVVNFNETHRDALSHRIFSNLYMPESFRRGVLRPTHAGIVIIPNLDWLGDDFCREVHITDDVHKM